MTLDEHIELIGQSVARISERIQHCKVLRGATRRELRGRLLQLKRDLERLRSTLE